MPDDKKLEKEIGELLDSSSELRRQLRDYYVLPRAERFLAFVDTYEKLVRDEQAEVFDFLPPDEQRMLLSELRKRRSLQ